VSSDISYLDCDSCVDIILLPVDFDCAKVQPTEKFSNLIVTLPSAPRNRKNSNSSNMLLKKKRRKG
jgi:hypothetical protein